MKPPALYVVETLFCSGLFLAVYRRWLVGRLPYRWCRRYLILTTLLAATIPALRIPVYPARPARSEVVVPIAWAEAPPPVSAASDAAPGTTVPAPVAWTRCLGLAAAATYLLVASLLVLSLVRRIGSICGLRRRSLLTPMEGYTLAEHPDVLSPFTFLGTVYIGRDLHGTERGQVLCHEASHVRHGHSAERLLMETLRCALWFNPFVWIAERALQEVQEWEADRDVLDAGWDLTRYRIVIFRQLFGYRPDITCGLNHSLTKKRFLMMTQFNGGGHALRRLGVVIPIVAGMILLCSFTFRGARAASDEPVLSTHADGADSLARRETRIVEIVAPASPTQRATYRIDSRPATLEAIADELAALPDRQRQETVVEIVCGEGVRMGAVTDLKEALRKARVYRILYRRSDDSEAFRILPPARDEKGVKTVELIPDEGGLKHAANGDTYIKERNVFMVLVNGSGQILAGRYENMKETQSSDLTETVFRFLANEENDPQLSEKETVEIALPDGSVWSYPQSLGMVSVQTTRDLDCSVYLTVQQNIAAAFEKLREQVARQRFSAGCDALTDAEREAVMRAVPLRIAEAEPHL